MTRPNLRSDNASRARAGADVAGTQSTAGPQPKHNPIQHHMLGLILHHMMLVELAATMVIRGQPIGDAGLDCIIYAVDRLREFREVLK